MERIFRTHLPVVDYFPITTVSTLWNAFNNLALINNSSLHFWGTSTHLKKQTCTHLKKQACDSTNPFEGDKITHQNVVQI